MEQYDTLLLACGSPKSRNLLRSTLTTRFNLLEATNTRQMLLLLEQNLHCIAAVVLDISNRDVLDERIQTDSAAVSLLKQRPVIIIADKESYRDLTLYFRYGAADVLPLNYDPYAMLHRIETIAQLTFQQKNLERIVAEQEKNLRHFSDNMVDALSSIIEYRDADSGHHILRIRNFTKILLEEVMRHCPEYELTDRLISIISSAAALHDVGKISIPDAILNKPGKLTKEEWEIMKGHSLLGCKLINKLSATVDQEFLQYAYQICRHHHERWDGQGYPDGLVGDEIPICAQVTGLADCYDALTTDRVYKSAYTHVQAVNMILSGECGAFSPKILECFKHVTGLFAQLHQEYLDGRDPESAIADLSLPSAPSPEQNINLLEKTQNKYYSIIHYLNCFLVEIQLDTGLFQVIYNPYPELANLQGATSLRNLTDIVAKQVVIPEEEERMYQVIWEEIPNFLQQDLRRRSFKFHHRAYADEPSGTFEMTFLRTGGKQQQSSLSIVCRKTDSLPNRSFENDSLMQMSTECTYVCKNDSGFTLVRPGRHTVSFGGYTAQEVMDIFHGRLLDMAFPEERAAIRKEFDRQLKEGSMVRTEYRFLCKDGSVGWVVNKSTLVIGTDGQEYLQTFLFDITSTKASYDQLSDTLNRYQVILTQTENVLFDLDVVNSTIDLSETWETIFGYKPSQAKFSRQMTGETHVHPDDISLLLGRIGLMQKGSNFEIVEIRIATIQGRYLWCRVRGTAARDDSGKLLRVLGVIINIDSEKQAYQALEDKANRDSLTQLLNKSAGRQRIEKYLSQPVPDLKCALILLDMDNFKDVNDHYGHLFGDTLLTQLSKILTSLFHSEDIIARVGGDEFMVLVQGVNDRQLLSSHCRRLRDMLAHSFRGETASLEPGCSIGVALYPEHATSYLELFSKADIALYQAKAQGKNNFCFYSGTDDMGYVYASHFTTPIDSDNDRSTIYFSGYQLFQNLFHAEDLNAAIEQSLASLGKKTNVSRVYIFENSEDDSYCYNSFEWCNEGITPNIQDHQHLSYQTDIADHLSNFSEEGVFYCHDIEDLPPNLYAFAKPQGIQSMLQCAIRRGGKLRGYVGFDECTSQRIWTKEEIMMLSQFSELLSAFLLRHRELENLQKQVQQLQQTQKAWSYIVDPETFALKQVTDSEGKQQSDFPPETLCYQALMGQKSPCEGCPLQKFYGSNSSWSVVTNPGSERNYLAKAMPIQWQTSPCYHITLRPLEEDN